jgi:hypothetical protein
MNIKLKITIPEPCHENWDKMTLKDNGRFCLSCSKTVIDFTTKLPDEIQQFFTQNQNQNICGRFKKSQLDTITIQIPSKILYTQTHYHKMFLLALFIAMGTTLFSCQDKNGSKQKIDKVEVVEKIPTQHRTVGEVSLRNNNSNDTLLPPPPKIDQVKFVKEKVEIRKTKKLKSKTNNSGETTKQNTNDDVVYNGGVAIETNAEFPGGIDNFYTFFGKEYKKPENSETANFKIRLSFAVERNGSITYLQSEPAIDEPIEKEIIRVFSVCPKWQSGATNGKKVRRLYSLPIVLQ